MSLTPLGASASPPAMVLGSILTTLVAAVVAARVDVSTAWTVMVLGIVALAVTLATGLGALLATLALLLVLPSAFGEVSLLYGLVAMCLVIALAMVSPIDAAPTRPRLPLILSFVVVASGMLFSGTSSVEFALLYIQAAVVVLLLAQRLRLIQALLRCLTILVVLACAMYLLTWALGFDRLVSTLSLGSRDVDIYAPFGLTGQGTRLWEGAPPRFVLLTGEPGLNVFYLLAVASYLIGAHRGSTRVVGLLVIAAATVVSQSLGGILAIGAGAAAFAFMHLLRRGHPVGAGLLALLSALGVVQFAGRLVDSRAVDSTITVANRGLYGSGIEDAVGNINLMVALERTPVLGVPLLVALALSGVVAVRTPIGAFAWTTFAVTATFAQPSQWQVGGWLLLSLVVILADRRVTSSSNVVEHSVAAVGERAAAPRLLAGSRTPRSARGAHLASDAKTEPRSRRYGVARQGW